MLQRSRAGGQPAVDRGKKSLQAVLWDDNLILEVEAELPEAVQRGKLDWK